MNGTSRRELIVSLLNKNDTPMSGTALAKTCQVSRQVIVNDIALLRTAGINIASTNRGYYIDAPSHCTRVFHVSHTADEVESELQLIIDAGGKVLDIAIDHPVYGRITAPLEIYSRNDIRKFKEKMHADNATPLSMITDGEHYHTVLAYSDEILDDVERALSEHGYLISIESL